MASDVHPILCPSDCMASDGDDKRLLIQKESRPGDSDRLSEVHLGPEQSLLNDNNSENNQPLEFIIPCTMSSGQMMEQSKSGVHVEETDFSMISRSTFYHVLVSSILVSTTTILTVLLPSFLYAVNSQSDAYAGLLFCSMGIWLLISLLTLCYKLWDKHLSLRPFLPWRRMSKAGLFYGLSGLAIFNSRARYRVLCHLQDPLAAALLPATVLCHLFFAKKVDDVPKLVCLAATIIGLFICVDFQIWDEFSCHGNPITTTHGDGQNWSPDEHLIWTVVYLGGLGLVAMFYTILEKEIRVKKWQHSSLVIPMVSDERNADMRSVDDPQPSTSEGIRYIHVDSCNQAQQEVASCLTFGHSLVLCMWLQLLSTITVLALFWTDLFSFLGKSGSVSDFVKMLGSGFACLMGYEHSGGQEHCATIASISWAFVITYSVLFIAIVHLLVVSDNCSVPYFIGLMALSLPLSTLWWAFFETQNGFQWAPSFSGEAGFTVVGLPLMVAALILYKYYASRE